MTGRKYFLIIDDVPVELALRDYFATFGFEIEQHSSLPHIDAEVNLPAAILINCKIIHDSLTINELYQHYLVPIIIMNNTADEETCVHMLDAGADDFIVKPINPRELHARVSAINRRVQRSTQSHENEKEILLFANWRLYPGSRQLFHEQSELLLSPNEYDLLLAFVRQPQHVLSREFLLQITTNNDLNPLDRRIDVQISRLRQKIEPNVKHPELIKTVRNGGYMFTAEVTSSKDPSANRTSGNKSVKR